MEINATLIVQMVHFFIACFMFKKLLLEPTITVIFAEENEQRKAEKQIAELRLDVTRHNNEKNLQWLTYQRHFREEMPRIADEKEFFLFRNLGEMLKPVVVDHSVVRKEKQRVEQYLIQKLGHVDE